MRINGKTRVYGVVGWPVEHSLSPWFQNRFIEEQGLNAVYIPFPVPVGRIGPALQGLHAAGVEGLNVTVPHKEVAARLAETDADARRIGAVNTLRRVEEGWLATNTDWRGLRLVIEGLGLNLCGGHVVMFGAGGTARAFVHALNGLGCHLTLCNRSPERASDLLSHVVSSYPDLQCEVIPWTADAVSLVCEDARLLLNATSLGLRERDVFPFELSGEGVAIDAVYRPDGCTPFCQAAAGRTTLDGLPLLVAQGATAFSWWHDADMPSLKNALIGMQRQLGRDILPLPEWC